MVTRTSPASRGLREEIPGPHRLPTDSLPHEGLIRVTPPLYSVPYRKHQRLDVDRAVEGNIFVERPPPRGMDGRARHQGGGGGGGPWPKARPPRFSRSRPHPGRYKASPSATVTCPVRRRGRSRKATPRARTVRARPTTPLAYGISRRIAISRAAERNEP